MTEREAFVNQKRTTVRARLPFPCCHTGTLADLFPGSNHLRLLGMAEADDRTVWPHANANGFLLVTLDSDFAEMAALYDHPPKAIWLRCGNQPTQSIEKRLRSNSHRRYGSLKNCSRLSTLDVRPASTLHSEATSFASFASFACGLFPVPCVTSLLVSSSNSPTVCMLEHT